MHGLSAPPTGSSPGAAAPAEWRLVPGILDGLADAALLADHNGIVLFGNRGAARLFGVAGEAALRGAPVAGLLSGFAAKDTDAGAPGWAQLQALTGAGEEPPPALELAAADGATLLLRCAPCRDATGAVSGILVTLADISLLRAAERQRDEVLSFLSHDLRSPQSSILALLELHQLDPQDNPVSQVHGRIGQYARRTLDLSERYLQLLRAETREFDFAITDLGPIAEEAMEEAWAAAEQKRVAIEFLFDGEPVPVRADPALLRRALINLLWNAVKYSPEQSIVTLSVVSRGDRQMVSIADQGRGMTAEDLGQLFGGMRRPAAPGQAKSGSRGLGLAFVKTVVDKHGGRIEVESVPDHGSCFTISLPPFAG